MSSLCARVTSLKSCAAAVLRPPYHSYTVNNDSSIYVPTASSTLLFLSSVVGSLQGSLVRRKARPNQIGGMGLAIGAKPNLYSKAIELMFGGSPNLVGLVERKSL